MTRRPSFGLAALLLATMALSACDTPKAAKKAIETNTRQAQDLLDTSKVPDTPRDGGTVSVTDGVWVGGRSLVKQNGAPLPSRVETRNAVVINSMGAPLELREIVAEIAAQTHLRIMVDIEKPQGSDDDTNSTSSAVDATGALLPTLPSLSAGAASTSTPSALRGMTLAWSGPLSGLMDSLAAYYDLSWEYRDNILHVFRYAAKTFTLAALPSVSNIQASINTSGTSGAAAPNGSMTSGAMLQNTSNETSVSLWQDILDAVKAMLPEGSYATMSPGTGTISVMAPPAVMSRVTTFIEEQNARITRQVTVSVKVLRVDRSDHFNLGFDLGVVFNQLSGQYRVLAGGPSPFSATDAGSWAIRAIQNTATGKGNWATSSENTQAVISALQQAGNVSLVTETNVTTLNGQAAPVSVARQRSYVASTKTSIASGSSSTTQTEVTPGTIITGFNMQVLPRILDDGEILLQYGLSLSDLREIKDFSTGTTTIQLPDVNIRSFLQQAMLRNGDVLVLAGYQAVSDTFSDRETPGLGKLFGGGVDSEGGKTLLVILLSPQVHAASRVRGL